MIKKSLSYHLESSGSNRSEVDSHNNTADNGLKAKSAQTSQGKVKVKNEITIGKKCQHWGAYLFKQYDEKVPGWFRTRFKINQRRRKIINKWLWEANVVEEYCAYVQKSDDWDYYLHRLYHLVNGGKPCI